jgi:hypothetical protein
VVGVCECSSEPSCSINFFEDLEQLHNCTLIVRSEEHLTRASVPEEDADLKQSD